MIKLNPNPSSVDQHFSIVKEIIQSRIRKAIDKDYVGRNPNRRYLDRTITNFLNDLLLDSSLEKLVAASPEELPNIVTNLSHHYPDFTNNESDQYYILKNIFVNHGYNSKDFIKLDFLKRFQLDTCPYCNRNYIYCLSKTGKLKPQIDHFFPKGEFPYLALSFYNLIPSCQTCNGFGAKEEKNPLIENLVNPYLLNHDNFRFTYKIKNINFLNPLLDKSSVEVIFKNKLQGHLDTFKLDKLYNEHSDHVLELIIKSKVSYSKKYREYLKEYSGLVFNEKEIDRLILGNYSDIKDIHKRPLSKLYQDIGRELGLIS